MKNRKIENYFVFVLALTLFALYGCTSLASNTIINSALGQDDGITTRPYQNPHASDELPTSYTISATTDEQPPNPQHHNLLYLSDINNPILLSLNQSGRDRTMVITIYFDYEPVQFRVGNSKEFSTHYVFDFDDSTGVDLPIYLDPTIPVDDFTHKLMFDIIAGYGEYAYDKEQLSNRLGMTTLYDLSFTEQAYKRESTLRNPRYELTEPENYFKFTNVDLMLNTDFSNSLVKEKRFEYPNKLYQVKADSQFELMYNVSNRLKHQDGILMLTVNFERTAINNQDFIYINLKNDHTSNGKITFQTPKKPGFYEVIGYFVFDPYNYTSGRKSDTASTSYRFTLEVIK